MPLLVSRQHFNALLTGVVLIIALSQSPLQAAANDVIDAGVAEREDRNREAQRRRGKKQPILPSDTSASNGSAASNDPLFKLQAVHISGAHAISASRMSAAYQDYLGRSVSEADLAGISDSVTKLYQSAGYLLSRAYIPPQDIEGGRLTIKVIEGSIANVRFEGGDPQRFGIQRIAARLHAEQPLTRKTFERQLLLINDTPGVEVEDTVLRERGSASGQFELTIVLKTWRAWAETGLDNRGDSDVGPVQGYANAALNSVLSPGGTAAVSISSVPDNARELAFGRISLEQPVGSDGTKLGFSASTSRLRPSGERRRRDTKIKTDNFTLKGTFVSYRSRERSLWLSLEAGTRLEEERDDSGLIYRDRIRALSLLADIQVQDRFGGTNFLTFNLRQGFSVFGASRAGDPNLSRNDGNGAFTKFYTSYYRNQALRGNWSFALAAQAQVSSDALLSSEEFYLGGSSIGRAFASGEISGDSGLGGVAELRYEREIERRYLKSWMAYGFIDGGAVWNRNSSGTSPLALASFGVGLRVELPREIRMGIELAKPFQEHTWAENGNQPRVSVTLSHSVKF